MRPDLTPQEAKTLKAQGKLDAATILLNRRREKRGLLEEAQRELMELDKLKTEYDRFRKVDERADDHKRGILYQEHINKKEVIVSELKTIHQGKRDEFKRI